MGKDSLAETDKIILETARCVTASHRPLLLFFSRPPAGNLHALTPRPTPTPTNTHPQVHQGRLPAAEQLHALRQVLPVSSCASNHTSSPPAAAAAQTADRAHEPLTSTPSFPQKTHHNNSFWKSAEMMNNIVTFHRLATAAVERTGDRAGNAGAGAGGAGSGKLTLHSIKQRMGDTLYKLTSQKFVEPGSAPEEELKRQLRAVHDELVERFAALEEEYR